MSAVHPGRVDGAIGVDELRKLAAALVERNEQLQQALDSRIVIEQAKGVLAERLGVELADAFEILRGAARSSRRRIHELAAEVTATRQSPPEIERELLRRRALR